MVTLLNHLLGSYVTHETELYNDTEKLMARLLSYLLDSYVTHVLHTAKISNDERALYNDTGETLMVRLISHLPGSCVKHVLHTVRISNDETVPYNDIETIIARVNILSYLLVSYVTHVLPTVGSAMMKE